MPLFRSLAEGACRHGWLPTQPTHPLRLNLTCRIAAYRMPPVLAVIAAILIVAGTCPAWATMPEPGEEAPSWTLRDIDGERVRFPQASSDRPVIVLFWGTWCPYCKALMPRLAELKTEFAAQRLEVFAIDFSEQRDPHDAIRDMNLPLVFLREGDAVAAEYDVDVVPALFLVQDGRVIYRLDYPPADHPSQRSEEHRSRARLLAPWWEERLRGVLESTYASIRESS